MKRDSILLLGAVVLLTLFGLLMIYDASSYVSFKDFGDKYHYIKDQIFWAILGFSGLAFFSFFDYRKLYTFSFPFLICLLFFFVFVFFPGFGLYLLVAPM